MRLGIGRGVVVLLAAGAGLAAPVGAPLHPACAQVALVDTPPGRPTARFCALRDLGVPSAKSPKVTEDPLWPFNPGAIALGPDSNFYSTSPSGGTYGRGTAFRITPKGEITVLHNFDGGLDGGNPTSGLIYGDDGWFYGTTRGGGEFKVGTIFRIKASGGAPQVLHHFRNGSTRGLLRPCKDQRCPFSPKQRADVAGSYPSSPPVRDARGALYGVTPYSFNQNFGTLYQFSPPYDSASFRTLCIFDPRLVRDTTMAKYVCDAKAARPAMVTLSNDGKAVYGTTVWGKGTVFKATGVGKVAILHEFKGGGLDGAGPYGVMQASDLRLYGTTAAGGSADRGTIFRMGTDGGDFTLLSSFKVESFLTGSGPVTGLLEGRDAGGYPDGKLYGVTRYGGQGGGRGILFRIKRNGDSLKVLHDFVLYESGRSPMVTPIQHPNGKLYGLTFNGGVYDKGLFYQLSGVDYPNLKTHDARFSPGVLKFRDTLITVRTHVLARQARDSAGRLIYKAVPGTSDGITVALTCRNPHFVQFIHREKITTLGYRIPGSFSPSSGSYPFTTDSTKPQWHSDATGKPNAYFDQGPGSGHEVYVTGRVTRLTIFDQPSFPYQSQDKPPVVLYDPADQADPATSQIWRVTAREFAICDCQVVREIWWTLEKVAGKQDYTRIRVLPADNPALTWINQQLQEDGFDPVP